MTMSAFETSVNIIVEVVQESDEPLTLQFASSCLLIVTREKMRSVPYLFDIVIDIMPILLESADALTQYLAITCAGYIFSGNNWSVQLLSSL
jgi:hypothetical protein